MNASLQSIFAEHFPSYEAQHKLHARERQAARCILKCYTDQAGSHLDYCPELHYAQLTYHACRHRSCPRCADRPRQQWLHAEMSRLLPCAHFHTIFTLPHELLALWERNREEMIALLMDSVRASLLTLLGDPRHLGATPGLLLSLHTWGRNLSHHPHVHALVSAGGVQVDGTWKSSRQGYLLPLQPLRKLFAGKLLAGLSKLLDGQALRLPSELPAAHWRGVINKLYRKHWNIQINAPYASGCFVAVYLARYAKGGPLPKDRELQLHDGQVSFEYTDHRDGRRKRLRLSAHEFIARILWHAPPKGVHTTRHAGLYATAARVQHSQALLALSLPQPAQHATPPPPIAQPSSPTPGLVISPVCPICGKPLQRSFSSHSRGPDQISYQSTHHPAHRPKTSPPRPEHLGPTLRSSGRPRAEGWPPGSDAEHFSPGRPALSP
jgi:hypothetical protein